MARPTEAEARTILADVIERGRPRAAAAAEAIISTRPTDAVLESTEVTISPELEAIIEGSTYRLHDNALVQGMSRAGIPAAYGRELQQTRWGRELLAHSLNTLFHEAPQRMLFRAVEQEIRGILSDAYRRLDGGPVMEVFIDAVRELGAVAIDGVMSDLRISLRAINPEVIMVNGDYAVIGVSLQTSDFGRGTLALSRFILRVLCNNGMTGESILRAVHLGRRIGANESFSQRTYDLDTQTMASAVGDLVRGQIGNAAVASHKAAIQNAADTVVEPKAAFESLKKVLTKGELEMATDTFMFGGEDKVPDGKNAWRLSNALSWVAGKSESAERRLDLERIAGELLVTPTAKAAVLDAILQ
jgi:plasmid stability protein